MAAWQHQHRPAVVCVSVIRNMFAMHRKYTMYCQTIFFWCERHPSTIQTTPFLERNKQDAIVPHRPPATPSSLIHKVNTRSPPGGMKGCSSPQPAFHHAIHGAQPCHSGHRRGGRGANHQRTPSEAGIPGSTAAGPASQHLFPGVLDGVSPGACHACDENHHA